MEKARVWRDGAIPLDFLGTPHRCCPKFLLSLNSLSVHRVNYSRNVQGSVPRRAGREGGGRTATQPFPQLFKADFFSLPSSQLPLRDPRSFPNKNIDVTLSKVSAANVLRIMRN